MEERIRILHRTILRLVRIEHVGTTSPRQHNITNITVEDGKMNNQCLEECLYCEYLGDKDQVFARVAISLYPQIRGFVNWDTHKWTILVSKPLLQPCDNFYYRWEYSSPPLRLSEFYHFLQKYVPSLYVESDVEEIFSSESEDEQG